MNYFCPNCNEELELGDFQSYGDCPECQEAFTVDRDAEFIDGLWRDRTKLYLTDPESAKSRPFCKPVGGA